MRLRSILAGALGVVSSFGFAACHKNDADREPAVAVENHSDDPVHGPGYVNTPEHHDGIAHTNEPSTNAVDAVPGAQGSAVSAITSARCEREKKCDNIGDGKKFDSMAKCASEIRNKWKDDLSSRDCKGGIVQKELNECLDAIRNEDCNNPFDTLGRVMACRESDICKALK
jgi:hypothetical protein